jgi:hypothetical protein
VREGDEQRAREILGVRQWISFEKLQGQRGQNARADSLAQQQTKVTRGEVFKWLRTQAMAADHQA